MTDKTVRLGVAGFGGGRGGGMAHIGNMLTGGKMVCAAAFEPNDASFERGCQHFECSPKRYPSIREMLAKETLDGFIIASPNDCHLANLKELEGQRFPVSVEKPLDSTWEKICDLVRFCRRYQGPVIVGHCLRYAPVLLRAKELLDQGAIGRICSVRYIQNCYYGNGMFHNWRRERARGGTMMIEKATHDLDLMQWLLGAQPVSVFASAKQMAFGGDKPNDLTCNRCDIRLTCPESDLALWYRDHNGYGHVDSALPCCFAKAADVPDDEMCLIQYDSGVHAVYVATYYTPPSFNDREIQIVGTRGLMEVSHGSESNGDGLIRVFPRYGTPTEIMSQTFSGQGRGHLQGDRGLILHFRDIILSGAKPQTTVEQAFLAEAVGYAAIRSNEERKEVRLAELLPEDLRDILKMKVF